MGVQGSLGHLPHLLHSDLLSLSLTPALYSEKPEQLREGGWGQGGLC